MALATLALCLISCNKDVSVSGISLDYSTVTVPVGGTMTLKATITPSNATNYTVTWGSSDASVASISSTGVLIGVSTGTATITATAGNRTATMQVIVKENYEGWWQIDKVRCGESVASEKMLAYDYSNTRLLVKNVDTKTAKIYIYNTTTGKFTNAFECNIDSKTKISKSQHTESSYDLFGYSIESILDMEMSFEADGENGELYCNIAQTASEQTTTMVDAVMTCSLTDAPASYTSGAENDESIGEGIYEVVKNIINKFI